MVHDGQATVLSIREELQPDSIDPSLGSLIAVSMRSSSNRRIIVFRKRLLAASETFIPAQAGTVPGWDPLLAGFKWQAEGRRLLADLPTSVLRDHAPLPSLARRTLGWGYFGEAWERHLNAWRPELIHVHFGPDALALLPLVRRLNLPLAVTFHGFDIAIETPVNAYRRRRHRVFAAAHTVFAVSDFIRQRLIAHGCPADKIVTHFIGIDRQRFQAPADGARDVPVLFVGRLVEKKGWRVLLQAMTEVQALQPHAHLHMVGDGPDREAAEALAHELGVVVTWHGLQSPERVAALMARAQVFCPPSIVAQNGDTEGLGLVNLEAQASGAPTVTFASGGVPEGIDDGVTGIVVRPTTAPALAKALNEIIGNREKRQRMSQAGPKWVAERFCLHKQGALLGEHYAHIVEQWNAGR